MISFSLHPIRTFALAFLLASRCTLEGQVPEHEVNKKRSLQIQTLTELAWAKDHFKSKDASNIYLGCETAIQQMVGRPWSPNNKHPCRQLGVAEIVLDWDWLRDSTLLDNLPGQQLTAGDLEAVERKFKAFESRNKPFHAEDADCRYPTEVFPLLIMTTSDRAKDNLHPCFNPSWSSYNSVEMQAPQTKATKRLVADHIVDKQYGGADIDSNLQWLDATLNEYLGNKMRESTARFRFAIEATTADGQTYYFLTDKARRNQIKNTLQSFEVNQLESHACYGLAIEKVSIKGSKDDLVKHLRKHNRYSKHGYTSLASPISK